MGDKTLAEKLEAFVREYDEWGDWPSPDWGGLAAALREAAALARRVEGAEVCVVPPDSFTTAVLNNHAREPLRVALVPVEGGGSQG
jgi:sugar phosphate isomerase/epimerase